MALFDQYKDLGYGLLLKRYTPVFNRCIENSNSLGQFPTLSLSSGHSVDGWHRIFLSPFCNGLFFLQTAARQASLVFKKVSDPSSWIAAELGWIVAEHGRQPWAVKAYCGQI